VFPVPEQYQSKCPLKLQFGYSFSSGCLYSPSMSA